MLTTIGISSYHQYLHYHRLKNEKIGNEILQQKNKIKIKMKIKIKILNKNKMRIPQIPKIKNYIFAMYEINDFE